MIELQDSPALPPDGETAATVGRRFSLVPALVIVSLVSTGMPQASPGAEVALELGQGQARIWRTSGAPESLQLEPGQEPKSVVAAEQGVVVAGEQEATGDLFFLHHAAGSTTELPVLPGKSEQLRATPTIVTNGDRMEGATWLEGSHQDDFSVRAAAWNGTSWETIEIVSAPTGRAQLAPASAVLSDGSWLVLWAGYDGVDDDIFWSRRLDGSWSAPRRLHRDNSVPDVVPSIVAQGDTAYVAWSYFDGSDYRVRTAHWNGTGWDQGGTLDGVGTFETSFELGDNRSFLTYRSASPEAWNLVELDPTGAVHVDRASAQFPERPLVVFGSDSAPRLSWPWRQESRQR